MIAASASAERIGRLQLLFHVDATKKSVYVNVGSAKGLPVAVLGGNAKVYIRMMVLPTSPQNAHKVREMIFKPFEGKKANKEQMRARSEVKPVASELTFDEEFEIDLSQLWNKSDEIDDFRLHFAVVSNTVGTALDGSNVFGCTSFQIKELMSHAMPIFDQASQSNIQRAQMRKPTWFWLFSPLVGPFHKELVQQLKANTSQATPVGPMEPGTSLEVSGRDGFSSNEMINDVYEWAPMRHGQTNTYQGTENNLWLYFLPVRSVWVIGSAVGSLIPYAYCDGTAADTPDALKGPWCVFSSDLDPQTASIDTDEVAHGAFFPDVSIICSNFDGTIKRRPKKKAPQQAMGGAEGGNVVQINKMTGNKPGATGLRFRSVPGRGQYIENVTAGYAADLTGQIQPGMLLLSVDGVDVRNMPKADVAMMIKSAGQLVSLEVSAADDVPRPQSRQSQNSQSPQPTAFQEFRVDKNTGNKPGSLGLKFKTQQGSGVLISEAHEGCSSALAGLQPGMVVVAINGIDIRHIVKTAEVVPIIKSQDVVTLTVAVARAPPRRVASPVSSPRSSQSNINPVATTKDYSGLKTIEVTVNRSMSRQAKSLGIAFDPRPDKEGMFITVIKPEFAVAVQGEIQVGMRILTINGVDLEGRSKPEVVGLLRSSDEVKFLMETE